MKKSKTLIKKIFTLLIFFSISIGADKSYKILSTNIQTTITMMVQLILLKLGSLVLKEISRLFIKMFPKEDTIKYMTFKCLKMV